MSHCRGIGVLEFVDQRHPVPLPDPGAGLRGPWSGSATHIVQQHEQIVEIAQSRTAFAAFGFGAHGAREGDTLPRGTVGARREVGVAVTPFFRIPGLLRQDSVDLLVDGLDCAACVWLIESLLARNPSILRARVILRRAACRLRWRGPPADANAHVGLVAALGFRPAPYERSPPRPTATTANARAAALPCRCGLCRRQRHAAVGRRLVGP